MSRSRKRRCGMRKSLALAVFLLGLLVLPVLNCYAESGIVDTYSVIGSRSCAYANSYDMFGPSFSLPPSGGTTRTGHIKGTLALKADGTGTLESYFTQYNHQRFGGGQSPVTSFTSNCDVVYEVRPGGLRLRKLAGCQSTIVQGAGIGQIWVTDDEILILTASKDGGILLLTNTHPRIETTWQLESPWNVMERVCSRTFMAIRQPQEQDQQ